MLLGLSLICLGCSNLVSDVVGLCQFLGLLNLFLLFKDLNRDLYTLRHIKLSRSFEINARLEEVLLMQVF